MKTTKQRDGDGPTAHSENIVAAAEGKHIKTTSAAVNPEDRAFGR